MYGAPWKSVNEPDAEQDSQDSSAWFYLSQLGDRNPCRAAGACRYHTGPDLNRRFNLDWRPAANAALNIERQITGYAISMGSVMVEAYYGCQVHILLSNPHDRR